MLDKEIDKKEFINYCANHFVISNIAGNHCEEEQIKPQVFNNHFKNCTMWFNVISLSILIDVIMYEINLPNTSLIYPTFGIILAVMWVVSLIGMIVTFRDFALQQDEVIIESLQKKIKELEKQEGV